VLLRVRAELLLLLVLVVQAVLQLRPAPILSSSSSSSSRPPLLRVLQGQVLLLAQQLRVVQLQSVKFRLKMVVTLNLTGRQR
jgi:hypothetical protein